MEDKVLQALSGGKALKAAEVAEAVGITKDEAAKVIKKLVKDGKAYSPAMCKYEAKK
ncbi:MAG: helix-turn-helix domain-containing protein [Rikenellaceae bacterium]|jgi:DNA-binding IscR family transcriptional regulator|nr:helix-turn-helix domain-containing protein [Rikenellaceae bacterium]